MKRKLDETGAPITQYPGAIGAGENPKKQNKETPVIRLEEKPPAWIQKQRD